MKENRKNMLVVSGIFLFFLLFLLPLLGSVHLFDWDEIIFAEAAREMMVTGDYLTVRSDFEPFYEKPPLFIWMQVLSMKVFGINEFAARLPNAVGGLLTLMLTFLLGRKLLGKRFGLLWTVAHACSILPFFYFRSGIIDPWFNLFTFSGITFFILYLEPASGRRRYVLVTVSAVLFGLAVLTKGPVAVLIFSLTFLLYLFLKDRKHGVRPGHVFAFLAVLTLTGGWWYLVQALTGNFGTVREFISYQAGLLTDSFAGHTGFPGFHFVILLFGVFPASVLFLSSFTKKKEELGLVQVFRTWMYILVALILLLFSIVQTKLVHYSSLAYFPITFLAAWVWENWLNRKLEIRKWQQAIFMAITAILSTAALGFILLLLFRHRLDLEQFTSSAFVVEALRGDLGVRTFMLLPGLLLLAGGTVATRWIARRDARGLPLMFISSLLFVSFAIYLFTPLAGRITQQAAVEFFIEKAGQDVHLETLGYKSFAPLFYGEKDRYMQQEGLDRKALLEGKSDREAFFVIKLDKKDRFMEEYPALEVLYEKNGYVFTRLGTSGTASE